MATFTQPPEQLDPNVAQPLETTYTSIHDWTAGKLDLMTKLAMESEGVSISVMPTKTKEQISAAAEKFLPPISYNQAARDEFLKRKIHWIESYQAESVPEAKRAYTVIVSAIDRQSYADYFSAAMGTVPEGT